MLVKCHFRPIPSTHTTSVIPSAASHGRALPHIAGGQEERMGAMAISICAGRAHSQSMKAVLPHLPTPRKELHD